MPRLTATQIYDKLLNEDRILTITGQIRFHLGDVSIIVKHKDVVGNIIQEWLEGWLQAHSIEFDVNPNTQMPPDVFLNKDDHTHNLLEVKAFNREAGPAFDIADFKAFVRELVQKPYHLDTDFLVFGYIMDEETGDVIIRDLWLKKIWEITKPSDNWPITVQYKNNSLNKMRPGNWYTNKRGTYPVFRSLTDYLSAFEETIYQNPETRAAGAQWKNSFKRSYRNFYGVDIDFPRWDDIKQSYGKR